MTTLHVRYNIILCKSITMAGLYVQNVVKPVVIYRLTYIALFSFSRRTLLRGVSK